MYGQNDHLSGQTFGLPVILTGNKYSVSNSNCKKKIYFTPLNFQSTIILFPLMFLLLSQVCSTYCCVDREDKFHVYVKWQHEFVLREQVSP